MVKSYIINLKKDQDRICALTNRLDELEISYERFEAVDANRISDEDFEEFCQNRPKNKKLGKWTKPKMGCNESHTSLWKVAAESKDPYTLIFEDDLHISDDLGTLLKDISWIPDDADVVRFEPSALPLSLSRKYTTPLKGRKLYKLKPNRNICPSPVAAGAYLIKKEAAERVLKLPATEHVYIDHALYNHQISAIARSLTSYQMDPACVVQDCILYRGDSRQTFFSNISPKELRNDIYQKSNPVIRFLLNSGKRLGFVQLIKKILFTGFKVMGLRTVKYK